MHGTHHEYDIHVPLVFWGAVKAGGSDEASTPYDLAPTLAAWLGVALPEAVGKARALPR
jgi:arylsulfatase A-like enzyme